MVSCGIFRETVSRTHARAASANEPTVQNADSAMPQKPLSLAGTNSRKREKTTGAPPSPTPTRARRRRREGKEGERALPMPERKVRAAVAAKANLRGGEGNVGHKAHCHTVAVVQLLLLVDSLRHQSGRACATGHTAAPSSLTCPWVVLPTRHTLVS